MSQIALRQSSTDFIEPLQRSFSDEAVTRAVSPSAARSVTFALAGSMSEFEHLEAEWKALFDAVARPEQVFQGYAWNWHWCRHYLSHNGRGKMRLAIVSGRIDGRLVLIAPFAVVCKAGLKQLCWMGEPVSQYGDIIAAPEATDLATMMAAWQFAVAATHADFANLRKVREDALVAPLLARLGSRVTATEEAPFIDIARFTDLGAFEATIAAKGRKNRRRKLRRMEELGPVTFETVASSEHAGRLASYALLLKRAWLRTRNQISLAMLDDRYAAFFADAARGGVQPTGCKVMLIRSSNETAAMQSVLENKGAYFLHIAVYTSKFDKVGPGSLLLEHSIAECFRDDICRFDFLAPRHDYKLEFTDNAVLVHDHALAVSSLGRAYTAGFLGFRRRLKAAAEAMPAPFRRVLMSATMVIKRAK